MNDTNNNQEPVATTKLSFDEALAKKTSKGPKFTPKSSFRMPRNGEHFTTFTKRLGQKIQAKTMGSLNTYSI